MTRHVTALVVGGGISGLVCAYALQKAGVEVQLVAASSRPGGVIKSTTRDGFLLELGPQSFSGTAQLRQLCEDLGISDQVVQAPPHAPRYVLIDGHLRKETADEWPVLILDLTDEEADKLLAAYDPLSAMAEADEEKLKALLSTVVTESEGLSGLLDSLRRSLVEAESEEATSVTASPEEFREYGEEIATDYCCPKCNYRWSGKPC